MYLSALLSLYTQRIPFELDFRVTQVLTDSSGTSRYGDSGSILKNRKIGALTYNSELAVSIQDCITCFIITVRLIYPTQPVPGA